MKAVLAPLMLAAVALAITTSATAADNPSPRELLRAAFGGAVLDTVGRFDYRLTVENSEGQVLRDARHALAPASARLHVEDLFAAGRPQVWSSPEGTWRLADGQLQFLGDALAKPYREHVAYHFLPMLASPQTTYTTVAPGRVRISPAGVGAFEVLLESKSGRILENRFDGGVTGRELDYRQVDGVLWPMQFDIVSDGRTLRHGRFSDVKVTGEPALPPLEVAAVERSLPAAQRGLAALIGAGWMSTTKNEYNLSMDTARSTIVFARSEADFEKAHIWIARREGERWSEPAEVPFSDPRYSDSDPWLAPDGTMLYFISNRPVTGDAPRKHLDIWRVRYGADGFGTPEHLDALSSDAQELGPEVHDGWIYFNSSRKGGPAPLSIYRARLSGTSFDAPEPLPAPFNEGAAQGDFTLSPDGRLAMFWSVREESEDADLFVARRDDAGWSKPLRLAAPFNAVGFDFTPSFTPDGRELLFASMRKPDWLEAGGHVLNGQSNLYVAPVVEIEAAFLDAMKRDTSN
ncbi:MAG TPA: hypothetical protein VNS57_10860 [Steroidobacteraceae bacterium]|nr:hypothetical protein [Steroidobacteraceae bacterium]